MKKATESQLVTACLQYLGWRGVLAWRANNTGVYDPARKCFRSFRGLKGVADILGILSPGGRLLACECKAKGGKPTFEQQCFLGSIRAADGVAVLAYSVADLQAALDDAMKEGAA